MRPEESRVQTNAGNPLADQSGVLSRRNRSVPPATTAEEELAGFFLGGGEVIVDRLSGLFCQFELDRLARLFLAHGCAIDRVTMRRNVLHPQADDIASSELAIYGYIEHGQVARSPCDLQLGTN